MKRLVEAVAILVLLSAPSLGQIAMRCLHGIDHDGYEAETCEFANGSAKTVTIIGDGTWVYVYTPQQWRIEKAWRKQLLAKMLKEEQEAEETRAGEEEKYRKAAQELKEDEFRKHADECRNYADSSLSSPSTPYYCTPEQRRWQKEQDAEARRRKTPPPPPKPPRDPATLPPLCANYKPPDWIPPYCR